MLWTIGVLAVGAACAGLLNLPGESHSLTNFLDPPLLLGIEPSGWQEFATSVLAVALAGVAFATAYALWGRRSETTRRIALSTAPLERILQDKFGFDRLYDWAFSRPAAALASGGQRNWEDAAVTGSMNVVAATGSWTSKLLSAAQSGLVRVYALAIAVGIVILAAWLMTGSA
jgi:NADH-quinone oxidoreductase subunit L